jgi:Cu/Ag efflux pump CusA
LTGHEAPDLTIGAGVGSLVVAALAFTTLGSVFLPQLDEGDLLIQSLRIPATSVQQSQAMQVPIERMMSKQPEVRSSIPRRARPNWLPTRCRPTPPTCSSS